jgi:hypothetical protein
MSAWAKFKKLLRRLRGPIDPPDGMWIETNGKRWRWAQEGYASCFDYPTRSEAVRLAWMFRDLSRHKDQDWKREQR